MDQNINEAYVRIENNLKIRTRFNRGKEDYDIYAWNTCTCMYLFDLSVSRIHCNLHSKVPCIQYFLVSVDTLYCDKIKSYDLQKCFHFYMHSLFT